MTNFYESRNNSSRVLNSIINRLKEKEADFNNLDDSIVESCLPVHFALFKSVIILAKEYKVYLRNLEENFKDDLFSYPSASSVQKAIDSLQMAMLDDENQYINFFIHDLDFGDNFYENCIVKDDKYVTLVGIMDLWRLLISSIIEQITAAI